MFFILVSMYGHGLGSSPMKELNGDILDLCSSVKWVPPSRFVCVCVCVCVCTCVRGIAGGAQRKMRDSLAQ